ncbi:nucleoside recognition GATE domain-containing membrane protein YjiH [Hathewaya proteolytica DSM 3090]|uniref:Nucleoside recognition GATE domain-containing membrane protein YjiH n=1 Tax=Hathewaya proteolytica DSM 3090 TaxID=1121331 RepID=A0A1M6R5Z2_9CLOT|nr:YjiH family protein [Hathewaya proteolytica]SHK27820.1 nucleoside recognition GATE domain-containing membrane protein YjiH [Hathewaya proteolytica DSM 3090]
MLNIKNSSFNCKAFFKFFIPSLFGIIFFMIPIKFNGNFIIPVALLSKLLHNYLSNYLPLIMTILICASLVFTLIAKLLKPKFIIENSFFNSLFNVSPIWFIARILGAIFAICIFFKVGPEFIWSKNTGALLLYDLLPVLFSVFLFAGLFLPILLNFGLLEFAGSLLTKVMRPIFNLPGRSSVDCIASWLGDGTIGVLLTSKQYEEGFYTKREASVIGTTFSFVSITFSLVVISQVNLSHMFGVFYLTIIISGIVAAIIIPRIPPLSRKENTYYNGEKCDKNNELIPEGYTPLTWGVTKAVERAEANKIFSILIEGSKNVLDMWIGVSPIVLAIGTLALILAEYTPIFQWLGLPFIPILNLLQIPEATQASSTLVVGFADMFLPTVIGASIKSELTRFVVAAVSVTQLIYMSEVGGLLLGSKIPVSIKDLMIIFLERTLITLPIIALIAHIIF